MQFTLPAFLALVSAASALVIPRTSTGPEVFTLSAPGAPSHIAKLGRASWDGVGNAAGGDAGWFKHGTELKIFIQNNKKEGVAFDSTNTVRELVLKKRVDANEDRRKLVLGQKKDGEEAEKFGIDMFAVDPKKPATVAFGYDHRYQGLWAACESKKGYTLWFGEDASKGPGCTEQFTLEVTYL